jgi:glycosyltransferase involved in cell wall biosynthesis
MNDKHDLRHTRPEVTILISTYNGRDKLGETLRALARLDTSDVALTHLILVDNASTDGTAAFSKEQWNALGSPYPLQVLHEPRPGKLHAQELGLSMVKTPFVVICDDDNALFPDYLTIGLRYLLADRNIGVLGGRGLAVSNVPIPTWFNAYSYFFACAPQAPATGEVRPTRNVVYGAGMWLRMEGYHRAKEKGFRFIMATRTGTSLSTGGEDSELCWALRFQGYAIWYVQELRFYHHVPADRLTEDYRKRLLMGMHSNGPLGGIYLRIANGEIDRPVKYFWVKELGYTLRDALALPFGRMKDKKQELRRMVRNIRFFLIKRGEYDAAVNEVLAYAMRCK